MASKPLSPRTVTLISVVVASFVIASFLVSLYAAYKARAQKKERSRPEVEHIHPALDF